MNELNTAIEALPDVGEIRADIRQTIRDAAGETYSPASLAVRSAVPAEADRLFQSLKLFVGETDDKYEGTINELSLGGANLIYLTLKLLEFKYQKAKQACANFLVIEEPEAHIHTHIQKTLFDRLSYPDTQVIYSTHGGGSFAAGWRAQSHSDRHGHWGAAIFFGDGSNVRRAF